jgi:lipopolysaccharide export LptBFGC system permease protein LptF
MKSRNALRTMTNRITNINIKQNSFDSISSFTIYASSVTDNEMKDVVLYKNSGGKNNSNSFVKILAKKGYFDVVKEQGLKINLTDGNISSIDRTNYNVYNTGIFSEYSTFIPFEVSENDYSTPPKYISTIKLLREIKKISDRDDVFKMKEEIISRIVMDISILILAFLSLTLAFYYERESKYFSFLISVGIIIFYYIGDIISGLITKHSAALFPYVNFLTPTLMLACFIYFWFFKLKYK